MSKAKGVQFNCFSPPVMLATLIFEAGAALYVVWRYKMSVLARLAVASLTALAVFQLSEYQVCTGSGNSAENWSRLGYVAISALPPLGLHLLHVLAGKPQRKLVAAAYLTMVGFVVYFLAHPTAFTGHQCTGNYVIFQIGLWQAIAYSAFYYGWLFTAIGLALHWGRHLRQAGKQALGKLQMVQALTVGYLVFLLPTGLVNSIDPTTLSGVPSIMCGFAVLFAIILVFYIVPRQAVKRRLG